MPPLRMNRFTVMAMLQAARARRLGFSEHSAHSWGLNRAIFYAAAKQGFRSTGEPATGTSGAVTPTDRGPMLQLGDESAYLDPQAPEPLFSFGGKTQDEAAFAHQIVSRFGPVENFRAAWTEAEAHVAKFPEDTLRSRRGFYDEVYRPFRDRLVAEWAARYGAPAPPSPRAPRKPGRRPGRA